MSEVLDYETDFYGWANAQAKLLRAGRLSEIDIEHVAEEIESLGKSEKRELESRLRVLIAHLLKWSFQRDRRGSSWEASIRIQRKDLGGHLSENPSLKSSLPAIFENAYQSGRLEALVETGLYNSAFPTTCVWSIEDVMSEEFWPD